MNFYVYPGTALALTAKIIKRYSVTNKYSDLLCTVLTSEKQSLKVKRKVASGIHKETVPGGVEEQGDD